MLVPCSSFLSLRAEDLLVFLCVYGVVAHSGDAFMYLWLCFVSILVVIKELVASQMGKEQASFSQLLFISLGNWGLLRGIEDLGQSHFPLPLASASGTSLVWWSVSCSVVGLVWPVGVGTEHITGGCVSSLTDL